MTNTVMALVLAGLLILTIVDPAIALAIGLLAAAGYARIRVLEGRIEALTAKPAPIRPVKEERVRQVAAGRSAAPPPAQRVPASSGVPAYAVSTLPPRPPRRGTLVDRMGRASIAELEELVAGRLLAVVGGIALFLGGVFFLGLAFSRGWIGPEARVAIGLIAGVGLFGLGGWLVSGRRQIVAHVLVAVGVGVFSVSLFAATRLYGFFAPEFGVAGALVASAAAAALAVRVNSQLIAGFGLVAVLASPPIMGASASLTTLLFIGVALAGTTAIALFRSWRWLPPIAFLIVVPQLVSYIAGEPPIGIVLPAIAAFWLLNAVSAGGEELRAPQNRLNPTSATVLLANAAFIVAAGFSVLDGDLERWRGLYLLTVATAHLILAGIFLLDENDQHPFGMLAAGSGIAAVTIAVPVQLGAEWVPLAWAAEAVALAWIYVEREHRYSGIAAAMLGGLAAVHILVIEYPINEIGWGITGSAPFVNESGMALAFVVLAAVAGIWLLRSRHERVVVAAVAATLVALATPHELRGWSESLLLAGIVGGAIVLQRRQLGVPLELPPTVRWTAYADRGLYATAALAAILLVPVILDALPAGRLLATLARTAIPALPPFANEATAIAAIVSAVALGAGFLSGGLWRMAGMLAASAVVAYLIPFQLGAAWTVVGWAAMAAGLHAASGRLGSPLRIGAVGLAVAAIVETLVVAAPPTRLTVSFSVDSLLPVLNPAILATMAIAAMLAARAILPPNDAERRWAGVAAGAVVVYAASIALVDFFQVQVGRAVALEELQKQAQVALSVLWGVIGAVSTVVGLRLRQSVLRLSGLGLLGLVTLKVFIIDLAALDVAYRVLSFVVLGILLLGAAFLYGRMQPAGPGAATEVAEES